MQIALVLYATLWCKSLIVVKPFGRPKRQRARLAMRALAQASGGARAIGSAWLPDDLAALFDRLRRGAAHRNRW